MKKISSILIFFVALSSFSQDIEINNVIVSSGGSNTELSFGTLEWSIGEVMSESFIGTDISITQGYHQPLFTFLPEDNSIIELKVIIFPNPTSGPVGIEIEEEGIYDVELFNVRGKLLLTKNDIKGNLKHIDLFNISDFAQHQFLLKIKKQEDIRFKTYKILRK